MKEQRERAVIKVKLDHNPNYPSLMLKQLRERTDPTLEDLHYDPEVDLLRLDSLMTYDGTTYLVYTMEPGYNQEGTRGPQHRSRAIADDTDD